MILRSPELGLLLLLLPVYLLVWWRQRSRIPGAAVVVRLLIVALLVGALTDPILGARSGRAEPVLALVIDQSESLGAAGKQELRERAAQAAQAHRGPVSVFYFGGNLVPMTLNQADEPGQLPLPNQALQRDASNIASALQAAQAAVGTAGGQIILFSDALPTSGDALAVATAAGVAGIPIQTELYIAPESTEIWLQALEVPPSVRQGETFEAQVVVGSTVAGTALIRFRAGDGTLTEREVELQPGENRFAYQASAAQPGILALSADLNAPDDTVERNNQAAATTLVAPAPSVLIVEGTAAAARPLQVALQPLSINTDVIAPAALPSQLSALERYESVVLLDVPAGDMTLDQMATLREFVRSDGRGLVAAGGKNSFTLGSYRLTPLEEALPVSMSPPQHSERPDISMLLIIDQSASMGPDTGDSKFNMAKESAILASEALRENDRIGVLAFDISQRWIVNFQPIGAVLSLVTLQEQITGIPLGGGTDILGALQNGLPALEEQPGPVRHAVLLTDGRSFTSMRDPYRVLIERMHARGLTISTIALGADSDLSLLREIAQLGGGRYYFAATPEDIPRLTLLESEIIRTEPQVEGEFRAELVTPHPTLRGFRENQLPALQGYVATTLKPEAELILRSPEDGPILAAWQYGLGRAVAWTPGIEAPWATNWSNWPEYGQFFAQLIRYTLPEPDSGPLQLRVTQRDGVSTIAADVIGPGGEPLDLAAVQVELTLPDGSNRSLDLRQVAPGRYSQDVVLSAEGAYALAARAEKAGLVREGLSGFVRGYPAEYRPLLPGDGSPALVGTALMQAIQQASQPEGTVVPSASELPEAGDGLSLWPWLVGLAALLWPLEVALRRGWITPGGKVWER